MADMGEIGKSYDGVNVATNTTREKPTRVYANYGGLGGVQVAYSKVRENTRGYTRQVVGTTKLNGVNTNLDVTVFQAGVPVFNTKSTPSLDLMLPAGTYEVHLHGNGTKRSETWGPTTVSMPVRLTLSGTLAAGTSGAAYSSGLTATGGHGTKTWDKGASTLPTGLSFNTSTGVISGTPTQTGTFKITIGVTTSHDNYRVYKDVILVVS